MSRFSKPLLALAFAILPFFLFVGSTNVTTINGEVVVDSRFNVLGAVLGLAGLWIAFRAFRSPAGDGAVKGSAAAAGILCVVQLASAVDLIRIDPLDWINPDRDLPALQYSGLTEDDRIILTSQEPEHYLWALRHHKSDIMGFARQHVAYADMCHGGRHRVDIGRAETMPGYFSEDDIEAIESRATALAGSAPAECSTRASNRIMGEMADSVNRDMDLIDRLEAEYLASL